MNEIIDDDKSIRYAQFEGKKVVPATYEPPVLRCNKDTYYQNILEFAKEMFPLSKFAYASDIHRNELVIWNRCSRRLGFKQKIRII
jgi:hypothetical protein